MNKRGFTLVELLAVIVILAVIALIATPIVTEVINKSEKGAAERSAENYIKAVDIVIGTERLNKNKLEGEYIINSEGNLVKDGKTIEVEVSGQKPSSGTIYISNGKVTTQSSMQMEDYQVSYDTNKKTYVATKIDQEKNGETISTLCRPATSREVTTGNVPSGSYEYGDEYICELGDGVERRFFVLENENDVSLIMNENLNIYISSGVSEAEEKLIANTKNWSKLNSSQIKLPTAGQIVKAAGHSESILSQEYEIPNLPTWLGGTEEEGNYWAPNKLNGYDCWHVWYENKYEPYIVLAQYEWDKGGSVRPVITISK